MEVVAGLHALPNGHVPGFVVVGVFDGLHRGHEYLLRHLGAGARRRAARPVVITFDHHPDEVITGSAPPLLCDPEERLVRLARAGVAVTIVVHFDARLRETTYEDFVGMVADRMPLTGFLMTPDAAFGYQRRGTPDALAALGARDGWDVAVVPPFALDGRQVRSTEIRAAIAAADLAGARRLLGRPHAVVGTPGARAGQGSVLAFPLPVALPPDGDYPVAVEPAWRMGAARGPVRPRVATVRDGTLTVRGRLPDGPVRVSFRTPRGR